MKTYLYPKKSEWKSILQRPAKTQEEQVDVLQTIFKEIQQKGDVAVQKYTSLFDGISLNDFRVTETEIVNCKIESALENAIRMAASNIEKFHAAQQRKPIIVETQPGVTCWMDFKAIEKVGLYIPGGTAPLFSTVLMLGIPAKIAGCKEVILCTPPDKNGNIAPEIVFAAKLCGITKIFKVGGIQAIAAMTFGTESIIKVDKIFGPGNSYVTAAKQFATQFGVAIDMPAGPSEVMVHADESANAAFVAADLLSQAEHGTDSQVVLVTNQKELVEKVQQAIAEQLEVLPRKEITKKALEHAIFMVVENEKIAVDIINEYAPEHLIVCSTQEAWMVENIQHAGSVFLGNYTPESAGDYASGTNHTLPTNGYAKNYSGVNLSSFQKSITYQKITPEGIKNIGNAVALMAAAEGLTAHQNAIEIRLVNLKG